MEVLLLVMALLTLEVIGQRVEPFDNNITIPNGNDVDLECVISGVADDQFLSWTRSTETDSGGVTSDIIAFNDQLTIDGSDPNVPNSPARYRLIKTSTRYTLEIDDAKMEDEGKFECSISRTDQKQAVWLTVKTSPEINAITDDFFAHENKTYELKCTAIGSPKPSIVWSRPGDMLPSGEYLSHGSILELVNMSSSHRGVYQCAASNTEGSVQATVEITMDFPPEIDFITYDFFAHENTTYELKCTAIGSPKPSIVWSRPGDMLPSGEYLSHGSILELVNMSSSHRGVYQCAASNTEGSVQATVEITMDYKPDVVVDHEVVTVSCLHDSALLVCFYQASPNVTEIVWTNATDGSTVNELENGVTIETTSQETRLSFSHVNMYDFGEYQCEISNLKGITSKTIRLEQHEEMQWDISPFDSNITAYIGDNITLVCNTVGLTECHEMSWIKKNSYGTNETTIARNKQLVSDGSDDDDSQARYHLVPNTIQYTVEIHGVDVRDEGQWECRVGDGYTQQTEIVWISLKYIEGNSITSTVISSTVTMATLFVLSLIILSKFI